MALAAIFVPQNRGGALFAGDQRRGLRLDHGQGIALGAVLTVAAVFVAFATGAIFSVGPRTVVALAIFARAVLARTFVPGTVITGTLVARAVVALTIFTGTIVTGVALALLILLTIARTIVAVAPTVAAAAFEAIVAVVAIIAGAVVALAALAVFARAFVTGTIVTPTFGARLLTLALVVVAVGVVGLARRLGLGEGGRLGAALILEVDLEPAEVLTADDLGGGFGRLHGAHDTEIMLGVLQVTLGEDPVASRRRVTGELLIFFENVLGVAAHLDAVGTVRIERPVRVLLLRLAATAAATIAAALALHTLEISHSCVRRRFGLAGKRAVYPLALVGQNARQSMLKT